MKFDSILRSNHTLKKNGYRILRKLHKLESRNGAKRAYAAICRDTYFFVLSCRALVDIIEIEYPEEQFFRQKCESFLDYLESIASIRGRIDKSRLASFLRCYTDFFNRIIAEKHKFICDDNIVNLWNSKCLMAYIASWGNNH